MINSENSQLYNIPWGQAEEACPELAQFLKMRNIPQPDAGRTLMQHFESFPDSFFEDKALSRTDLLQEIVNYADAVHRRKSESAPPCGKLTIIGGHGKDGSEEHCRIDIKRGEIFCVVGPTGSGKSQLLADIECLAQGDTPTGRYILVDEAVPGDEQRFSAAGKLVAQLSQNMNFVMDIEAEKFLLFHAQSRHISNECKVVKRILAEANALAGEPFSPDTPLNQLSGGQSRALLIADTAFLSSSPIVLIDELENAGIDRRKAINLMVKSEKIVIISTHDPLQALLGYHRAVMAGGKIQKVLRRSADEEKILPILENFEARRQDLQDRLRTGESLDYETIIVFNGDRM